MVNNCKEIKKTEKPVVNSIFIKERESVCKKSLKKLSLAEQIFSVRNDGIHKAICLLGIKFKFKNSHKELLQKIDEMQNILNEVLKYTHELNYRNIFLETTSASEWLSKKSFTLISASANYSFIFELYNILNLTNPDNILEFGLGQTSLLTSQYTDYYKKDLIIIDHMQEWIDEFSKKLDPSDNIKIVQRDIINYELDGIKADKYSSLDGIIQNKKFNLIIIDGPIGFNKMYPRGNILDLIPQNLSEHFVIILDDVQRLGEQNIAKLIFEALRKNGIEYKKSYKHGLKSQLIISSTNYKFIHWY